MHTTSSTWPETRRASLKLTKPPRLYCHLPREPPRRMQTGATIVDERAGHRAHSGNTTTSRQTATALNRQPFPKRRLQGGIDAHGADIAQSRGFWVFTRELGRGGENLGPQQCLKRKNGATGRRHCHGNPANQGFPPVPVSHHRPPNRPQIPQDPTTSSGEKRAKVRGKS
jgi:hypothetical protein